MTNPLIHALVLIAAIIIPGGMLAYFAWHAARKRKHNTDNSQTSSVAEAQAAFKAAFPLGRETTSLRERSRRQRLNRYNQHRRKISPQ